MNLIEEYIISWITLGDNFPSQALFFFDVGNMIQGISTMCLERQGNQDLRFIDHAQDLS